MNPAPARRSNDRIVRLSGAAILATWLLGGCSWFGKDDSGDQPEYYGAVETAPLEIPEGLATPTSTTALMISRPPAPLPQRELQPAPPRVSSTTASKNQNSSIRWGSEGAYLLVEDTAPSVERRLGFVIKRAGMAVQELNDNQGYRVEYWHQPERLDEGFFSRLAFWRDDPPNYSGVYQVTVRPDGDNARVYVKNPDGSEPDPAASEHLLVILGERLG